MTVTINLDSREAFDALPAVFFWPVPDFYDYGHDGDGYAPLRLADPEWVKAGEPCETCEGIGCDDPKCPDDECDRWHGCPDCFDGKPLIAITVPCETCYVAAWPVDELIECGSANCLDGRVTVGQAVIEHGPLPIVGALDPSVLDQCYPLLRTSTSVDDGIVFEVGPEPEDGFIVDHPDPASLVGTWGVICWKVQP